MPPMRSVFAVAAVLAGHAPATAQVSINVGPNVNVSRRNSWENETAIVIDRSNTNRIAIASNTSASNVMLTASSTNGGANWTTAALNNTCCDPWLGSDSFGNLYLATLTSNFQVGIQRSTNGGASYNLLTSLGPTGGTDHPELAAGPSNTAGQQSVWVTYRNTSAGNVANSGATSTGSGNTSAFTTPTALSNSGSGSFGDVAVGPGGRVASVFMTPFNGVGPSTLRIHYDSDGVGTGSGFVQQPSNVVTQVGGFRSIPAQPNRTIDTQVKLAYDFTGGSRNGTLYMLYTQAPNTTSSDTNIVIRRSTDNGATFTSEVRINDDTTTRSQFFGRLAVDQTTGHLAAVWFDCRNSSTNILVELWGSVSTDGGQTWGTNFKISQGQWSGVGMASLNELGDYISMDFHNGVVVAAWPDASNSTGDNPNGAGNLDIYFARVLVTPVPEPGTVLLAAAVGLAGWRRLRGRA